jgi:hypothetical protein
MFEPLPMTKASQDNVVEAVSKSGERFLGLSDTEIMSAAHERSLPHEGHLSPGWQSFLSQSGIYLLP